MDDIRNTRPWFWILVVALAAVALAAVAIVALVIALSANKESIDQKQVVAEATAQIKEEVSGLNTAIKAADEFQEESDELAAQDRKRIRREVNAAVAGGEGETQKLKKRVASLEGETSSLESDLKSVESQVERVSRSNSRLTDEHQKLKQSDSRFAAELETLEAELAELEEQVTKLK